MKIYFERSGGFTGRSLSTTVDTDRLPSEQALSLLEKVDDADFFELPESTQGPEMESVLTRDQLSYKVTIEVAGVEHTVETSDTNAPQQLQPLLRELSHYAREVNRPASTVT